MLRSQGALAQTPAESKLLTHIWSHVQRPLRENIQSGISVENHNSIYNQTWLIQFILLRIVRI